MNTLFTNEKLGMPVEAVRLAEIRQQIDAQRLADEVKAAGSDRRSRSSIGWLNRARISLIAPHRKRGFSLNVSRLFWYPWDWGDTPHS